jgi:hypothetical protein
MSSYLFNTFLNGFNIDSSFVFTDEDSKINATQKSNVPKVIWNYVQWLKSLLFTHTEGIFYYKLCLDGWGKFNRKSSKNRDNLQTTRCKYF